MGNITPVRCFARGDYHVDVTEFERVSESFKAFHESFSPFFGRKQWRERSRDYLNAILVQNSERRNAENLAEVVPASARVLQRFLTEARWNDNAVVEQLQAYVAPRLNHWDAVWALDDSGFPKQGNKSAGVGRQYCGQLGKIANCQCGVFLALVGPRGRMLVDKRLYLPQAWIDDSSRCEEADIPADARAYKSKTDLALELLAQAKTWSHLTARWVTGDDLYGNSPGFRDGVAKLGFLSMLEVQSKTPTWPIDTTWEKKPNPPTGRPTKAKPIGGQRLTVKERAEALNADAWQVLTVAEGAQGPRAYQFAFERYRDSREHVPGVVVWLVHKKNLDGTEPRYYFSNAPEGTPEQELARVACARWPIETEFELTKTSLGLGDYEVRSWPGWHHHMAMCFLANAFLLTLQQEWGEKDAGDHPAAGVPDRVRVLATQALRTA